MNALEAQLPPGPVRIVFEGIGTITLPGTDTLAFLGGIGVLALVGMIEWPVAVLFAVVRLLTANSSSAALRGLGDALAITR